MNTKIIIYQLLVRLAGNTHTNIKPWGTIQENGCGKFGDLDKQFLQKVKEFGATHIWFTGVLEHASCSAYPEQGIHGDNPLVVKGRAGSPYAIKDYFDVCPDLARNPATRMAEFESLLERCHYTGLKAIIDFVPNHVARKYDCDQEAGKEYRFGAGDQTDKAFHKDNNFYYLPGEKLKLPDEVYSLPTSRENNTHNFSEDPAKATGNDCFSSTPSYNDWYETVKLNYGVNIHDGGSRHFDPLPDTWRIMHGIVRFWASKGVDGFRCDMAEMVPAEFWQWMIAKVKQEFPNLVFIAEIYNPDAYRSYHQAGFDFLYDKVGFYNTLKDVMLGAPAGRITTVWQSLGGMDDAMLRFLENHDEERIASHHFAGNAQAGIPAMAVAATMNKGPLMVYFGQETGEKAEGSSGFSGDDGKTTIFDYGRVPSFQKWYNHGNCNEEKLSREEQKIRQQYRQILQVCKEEVFVRGHFYDLMWANTGSHPCLYAFLRWTKKQVALVAANFSHTDAVEARISIPGHFLQLMAPEKTKLYLSSETDHKPLQQTTWDSIMQHGINIVLDPMAYAIIELTHSE